MRKLVVLGLFAALVGCAAHGREVTQEQLSKLQKGSTTIDQALSYLGPPQNRMVMGNGDTYLTYVYGRAQARPENFIPIVGPLVGGYDTYSTTATLTFNANGVLRDYTASQGGTAVTQNLMAGSARGRQSNPVEATETGQLPESSSENATTSTPQRTGPFGVFFFPGAGAQVYKVTPDSPAWQCGLRPGDVIVEFGGTRIVGYNQFGAMLLSAPAGTKTHLVFTRGGERHEVEAVY